MSDDKFSSGEPFQFRPTFIGRLRALWHGIAGRWVETHLLEQQDRFNWRLNRQQLDLAELVAMQDRETTQLKRMITELGAELRLAHEKIDLLEGGLADVAKLNERDLSHSDEPAPIVETEGGESKDKPAEDEA